MMGGPKLPAICSGAVDSGARIARSLSCFLPTTGLLLLLTLAGLVHP